MPLGHFNARALPWFGVVGPVGFVAAWVIAGLQTRGYSPVDDAISLLAASDASTRGLMTAGFVCFGVGVPVFAFGVLRRAVPGSAWIAAVISGVATLVVAAFPLHVSSTIDAVHGACAGTGYVALALVPFLAAHSLREQRHRRAAFASTLVAMLAGLFLAATVIGWAHGLFQRAGLTVVDIWLVLAAIALRPAVTRQNLAR